MSYSFPQYNNSTPSENYKTPYSNIPNPNIPNHSTGSLPPFCGQQDMMSPSPESSGLPHSDDMISPSMDLFNFQQRPDNSPQQGHELMVSCDFDTNWLTNTTIREQMDF